MEEASRPRIGSTGSRALYSATPLRPWCVSFWPPPHRCESGMKEEKKEDEFAMLTLWPRLNARSSSLPMTSHLEAGETGLPWWMQRTKQRFASPSHAQVSKHVEFTAQRRMPQAPSRSATVCPTKQALEQEEHESCSANARKYRHIPSHVSSLGLPDVSFLVGRTRRARWRG